MNLEELFRNIHGNGLRQLDLVRVDIVSPYISEGFFQQLLEFNPGQVRLVVDAGCSERDISGARELLAGRLPNGRVRLGQCQGLVHSKLFLFDWINPRTGRHRRVLVWGSGNATAGGFGRNSEAISWAKLRNIGPEDRNEVNHYFADLNNEDEITERVVTLGPGIVLHLPEMRLEDHDAEEVPESFELWLQKGIICHKYDSDSRFRFIRSELENPIQLPRNIGDIFTNNGFNIFNQNRISYDYLQNEHLPEPDNGHGENWKARYFIDTVFGRWTSYNCYEHRGNEFFGRGRELREAHIQLICNATPDDRERWVDSFLGSIQAITRAVETPELYFRMDGNDVDTDYYSQLASNQIRRDILKSQEDYFRRIYINGYEFVEMPSLREFHENWQEFALSWCSSLLYQMNRSTMNKIARYLLDAEFAAQDVEELYAMLVDEWEDIGDEISQFYLDE